jgi:hypothetical protein
VSSSSFMKRLKALERSISFRRPRWITILVDGNGEDQSAADAILQELAIKPAASAVTILTCPGFAA